MPHVKRACGAGAVIAGSDFRLAHDGGDPLILAVAKIDRTRAGENGWRPDTPRAIDRLASSTP
jgi:hypothetical protein